MYPSRKCSKLLRALHRDAFSAIWCIVIGSIVLVGFLHAQQNGGALLSTAQALGDPSALVPVEFEFYKEIKPPDIGVGLQGTFNNWGGPGNAHPIPMANVGGNIWKVTVPLAIGRYEYKFVTYQVSAAGDTGNFSWFTDPNNPDFGGPFNNSYLTVDDPMIYYLLPMNNTVTNDPRLSITAKISWANSSSINLSSLTFLLDNFPVPNPAQYFDTTSRIFRFTPSSPLEYKVHTVELSIANNKGSIARIKATFSIVNRIIAAPYTFIFDPLSPNFKLVGSIKKVEIKGTFNNLGSDPMAGPDSDGVYTYTVPLKIGVPSFYQYIINGGQYIDDPDNPLMQADFGTIAIKQVQAYPTIKILGPRQGQIFPPGASLAVRAQIFASDSGYAIDKSSVKVFLDSSSLPVSSMDSVASGIEITSSSFSATEGRHQVRILAADVQGMQATADLTFGAFATNTGFHYVDADNDDNGPGNYTYPSFTPRGSADIKSIDVVTNSTNDSLLFTVTFASISDYTRLGFEIVNSLNVQRVIAPDNAGVKVPDFTNHGVFFIIAAPNSSQLSGIENKIYTDPKLLSSHGSIAVSADAKTAGVFRFAIPIDAVENAAGSFSGGWYFISYSYLANSSGGWKVPPQNGGSSFPESPNIYDAAFFFNTSIEKRNLSNYNFSFNYGGSRYVTLASNMRGALLIMPGEISAAFLGRPMVKILTDGGEWRWSDTVTVYVYVSDSTISSGILRVNSSEYPLTFVHDTASAQIVLSEGLNELQASVPYGTLLESTSAKVYFNLIKHHRPTISIAKNISGREVTFDASATTNPDGLVQTFSWSQDRTNPAQIAFSSTNSPVTTFTVPEVPGEYYYTLTCSTSRASASQRVVLLVDSSGASFPDISFWHAGWIDSAVVYEVYVRTLSLAGNLQALARRMRTIKQLGANAIWLMPIHPGPQLSPSQPGYAITNYFDVNPLYGSLQDFKAVVDSAHANGIRVILDYVVNHTHNTHPFMLDAAKYGAVSPYRNFYYWTPDGSYQYLSTWTDLPSINYDYQQNMDYLLDVAKFWLENFDIDGFRCDAAWAINDTTIRPSGPAFWQRFRRELKTIKPDVYLVGELDATNLNYFDKKFDSGYDWLMFGALKDALTNSSLLGRLDSVLAFYSSSDYPSFIKPFRFIENHDEERLIAQYPVEKVKLAAAVLLTLPGVPMIYAGQEVGELSYRGLIDWTDPNNLQPFYQKLISIRRAFPSLSVGKYVKLRSTSPDSVIAFARVTDSLPALVVCNFTEGHPQVTLMVDSTLFTMEQGKQYYLNDVLNGKVYPVTKSSIQTFSMMLPPNGSAVMILADTAFITTGLHDDLTKPVQFSLEQNYPNPFNPTTTIRFSVGGNSLVRVTLSIYNVLGQKVKTLVDDYRRPGVYSVQWDGCNGAGSLVASGVYFYVLHAESFVKTKKMLLLR